MPIASSSVQPSPPDSSLFTRLRPVQADRLRDPKQQQPVGGGESGGGGRGGLLPFPVCLDPRQPEEGAESRGAGLNSRPLPRSAASSSSSPQHPLLQVTPAFSSPSSFYQSFSSISPSSTSPSPPRAPSFLHPAFLEPPRTRSRSAYRSGFMMNQQHQQLHAMPGAAHFPHHQLQTPQQPPPPFLFPTALHGPNMDRNDNRPPEGARQPHSPSALGARRRGNSPNNSSHIQHQHMRSPAGNMGPSFQCQPVHQDHICYNDNEKLQ
ncbi:hypothetical protein XELAEV_18006545mg [Xenopus laevis]|uniref:Uncharacterized protein n=1 Tax=Xenopus laevis TaxID=8355 RepID=A0A974E0C8_XENLA|nr:hypothetical protein XELAEV_18006545mg [Xenopus laevis]